MPEKPLLCLGETWLELTADTPPELAGQFQVQVGGWGAGLCRAYTRCGGRAVLLSQLGADSFGRKAAAQLAADGVGLLPPLLHGCSPHPGGLLRRGRDAPYRTRSSELCYAPEQLDADTFRDAFALCFSSACLLDSPARLTHLKAIAAAAGCRHLRLLCAPDDRVCALLAGRSFFARNSPRIFSTGGRFVVEKQRPFPAVWLS